MSQTTIYDVSRLSGVSTATVSRAFSEPDRVREETKRKVYEAAATLNYQPSAIARAMAKQRTDKLAFIICKQGVTLLDDFYAGICEGVMSSANSMEYQLVVTTQDSWRGISQKKQFEGAILAGEANPELISELQQQNVEVVLANHVAAGFDLPYVLADEQGGVFQAIEHLASKGHTNIAMLAGRFSSSYISRERYNAFLTAVKKLGLSLGDKNVVMCDRNIESAVDEALGLLKRADRPTAIFAFNDVLAAGVLKAAHRMNLRVPEDLAVVGFDDSPFCKLLDPELTSVHVDCFKMGEICIDRMNALLSGQKDVERLTLVPVSLKIRSSS